MGNSLVRYFAAILLMIYGFAKINGSQFTILDSELDKPMGEVSGFWLTWYYFGYSAVYGNFIALVQIVGAVLLTFRRTALLGACMLAPMLANIVLIDVFYGVEPSATLVAILLLALMISLIAPEREKLIALFLPQAGAHDSTSRAAMKWGVRISMVLGAFALTYWTVNYNNRAPTPIDGTWDVVQVEPQTAVEQMPSTVFFEFNRAGMAVFKLRDGSYQTHHFELDGNQRIRIWETWMRKGPQIFEGRYAPADPDLILNSTSSPAALILRRKAQVAKR